MSDDDGNHDYPDCQQDGEQRCSWQGLHLGGCTQIRNTDTLTSLTKLKDLYLTNCPQVNNQFLRAIPNIRFLYENENLHQEIFLDQPFHPFQPPVF